jgi:hypothetical protein
MTRKGKGTVQKLSNKLFTALGFFFCDLSATNFGGKHKLLLWKRNRK